jgi:GNAT superfamily N-acetyltransferase
VTEVTIRPLREEDASEVVKLRHQVWVDDITTPATFLWDIEHEPAAAEARRWVATDDGRVVGMATALRATWSSADVAQFHVVVGAPLRGRGIGGRLFAEVEDHLVRLASLQVLCGIERGDEPSARFVRQRGFLHGRDDHAWSLDPRGVSLEGFAERRAAAEAAGFGLVPLRELPGRPRDLHRLILALEADLPSDIPIATPYEEWLTLMLEAPSFSPDASFCMTAGDEPIALTWIWLDEPGGRARHGMTGTLAAYRHRGLARLVKLASIGWLAEHGVSRLFTDNDAENHDMLALNEHLGYRPLTVFEIWMRGAPAGIT